MERKGKERKGKGNILSIGILMVALCACGDGDADPEPFGLTNGPLVEVLGTPDVAHYRGKVMDRIMALAGEVPASDTNRDAVVRMFSRFSTSAVKRSGGVEAPEPLDMDEVMVLDRFLGDHPAISRELNELSEEFVGFMNGHIQAVPVEVHIQAETNEVPPYEEPPNNMTSIRPAADAAAEEYVYKVYPDEDGYYDLPGGPVHGIEYLETEQRFHKQSALHSRARGFSVTWSSTFATRGEAWPGKTITFVFGDGKNAARIATVSGHLNAIATATGLDLTVKAPNNVKALWNLGAAGFVYIDIYTKSGLTGNATVGRGLWRRIQYHSSVVDSPTVNNTTTIQHEICHVLAMLHEHQRYDRHNFVGGFEFDFRLGGGFWDFWRRFKAYDWNNYGAIAAKEKWGPFNIFTKMTTSHHDTPYDYNSIMHYQDIDNITIRNPAHNARARRWRRDNLTRYADQNANTYLTPWDVYTIRRMYGITPNVRPGYTPGED